MAEVAQNIRQLKIKTGVVNRLFKEERTYQAEVKDQQAVVEKLKSSGADGADIRNAERVLKDSEQMIPRTKASLKDAHAGLKDLVDALKSEEGLSGTTEYKAASDLVAQVEAAWKEEQ